MKIRLLAALLSLLSLSACIHLKVHVPRADRPPQKPDARDLRLGKLDPLRDCYDAQYYEVNLRPDFATKTIQGTTFLRLDMLRDADTLAVNLDGTMHVSAVEFREAGMQWRQKGDLIYFWHQYGKLRKSTRIDATVTYSGRPRIAPKPPWYGGFVWKKDDSGNPWAGVVCEGLGASFWWPNKDHPTDEPDSMRIRISVPHGLAAVCNGSLVRKYEEDGLSTWEWQVHHPINNYNVTFAIGKFSHIQDTLHSVSGRVLPLDYWVLPENEAKARKHFRQVHDVLHFLEARFGAYPWPLDGYKLLETPFVGMEHQSAIAYGNGYSNDRNYFTFGAFDYIILHESAHEWWGNSLTACDLSDAWLHEGFATYSEALYVEHMFDYSKAVDYLMFQRMQIHNRQPIVGPRGENSWNPKDGDIYMKGTWILHTLRNVLRNDALFLGMLKSFAEQHRHSIVCSEDFIAHVNRETKQDYSLFFQQYLFSRKPPHLEYFFNGKRVFFRFTGVPAGFVMPVEFLVNGKELRVTASEKTDSREVRMDNVNDVRVNDREYYVSSSWNSKLPETDR